MSNKIKILAVSIVGVILMLTVGLFSFNKFTNNETKELSKETKLTDDEIEINSEKIKTRNEEYTKIEAFVISQIQNQDIFLDISLKEEVSENELKPKEIPIKYFISGLKTQNQDIFGSAFTFDALNKSLNDDSRKNKDIVFQDYMLQISKENTIQKVSYQFHVDTFGRETNKGILRLRYDNKKDYVVPFELQEEMDNHGESDHTNYLIKTPLKDFLKILND